MTAFVLVFAPVFTALFGVLFAAVVALRPPGLPLSVRVPQSHADDPVISAAIRRFRWSLVLAWVLTAVLTAALAVAGLTPLATVLPVLLYSMLAVLALVLSRRLIVRAKREGDWFEGVPVRVSAQITQPEPRHPPLVWPASARSCWPLRSRSTSRSIRHCPIRFLHISTPPERPTAGRPSRCGASSAC